ncbi:MAG: MBL fold metallo-hydrolase [Bacillaceae bacterium]|nr:MBL fold metallo-hydrolase [Bacillaceae bacterium]
MKRLKLLILLMAVLVLIIVPINWTTNAVVKNMYVHFINVGQGDSIYIKAPNGEDILIDGGNKDGSDVVAYLKKQKVKDIEVMIATHPDADHIGGLDEVLNAFVVRSVYAPKVNHTSQAYRDFLNAVKREGLKIKTAQANVTLPIKGVTAKFVGPVKAYSTSDTNDWSAVLRLTYGKNTFLFTGDAEFKAESDMIKAKQPLKADVLKVGHHGAKTSTSTAFLNVVKPKYAVISVGKNSYGHPTKDVLNRLKAVKAIVYRTDQKGTIIFISNGSTLSVKTERR